MKKKRDGTKKSKSFVSGGWFCLLREGGSIRPIIGNAVGGVAVVCKDFSLDYDRKL